MKSKADVDTRLGDINDNFKEVATDLNAVKAVLRRSKPDDDSPDGLVRFGDIELNLNDRTARRNGDEVSFTRLEFEILAYVIEHQGRTVNRKQLFWGSITSS